MCPKTLRHPATSGRSLRVPNRLTAKHTPARGAPACGYIMYTCPYTRRQCCTDMDLAHASRPPCCFAQYSWQQRPTSARGGSCLRHQNAHDVGQLTTRCVWTFAGLPLRRTHVAHVATALRPTLAVTMPTQAHPATTTTFQSCVPLYQFSMRYHAANTLIVNHALRAREHESWIRP